MRFSLAVPRGAALVVAGLVAAACTGGTTLRSSDPSSPTLAPAPTTVWVPEDSGEAETPEVTTTTESRRAWTLLAGGDVKMERFELLGLDPFAQLEPSLRAADFSMINVETTISDRGTPYDKDYVFRAPPSAADTIAGAGVTVANLANNHAKDYGPDALLDTVSLLEAAGVATVGAGRDAEEAYQYRLLETDAGLRVAFVGISYIVPLYFGATASNPGVASAHLPSRGRVLDTVRAATAASDVVVVSVHWGIERNPCPNVDQRTLAQQLLDAGADAVIGHHPHVLQPVEHSGGKLVAYSLGNFVWDHRPGLTGETGVLQIDFDGDAVVGWTLHPHLLDDNGMPVPADSGNRVDRIAAITSGNCEPYMPAPAATAPPVDADNTADTDAEGDPATTTLPPPTGTAGA